jgi:hypothetical protein
MPPDVNRGVHLCRILHHDESETRVASPPSNTLSVAFSQQTNMKEEEITVKEEEIIYVPAIPLNDATIIPGSTTATSTTIVSPLPNYGNSHAGSNHYCVDLPLGHADVGIQIHGSPPQITFISQHSPLVTAAAAANHPMMIQVGHYVHGIALPEIEIVHITDSNQLQQLIQANPDNPRRLYLSPHAYFVDPLFSTVTTATRHTGVLYKHYLPTTSSHLGIGLHGFPPFVTVVHPSSPLVGRLHPGQVVEALFVPGQPLMNLAAGAFTTQKVEERLHRTGNIPGRILVVKDAPIPKAEKGSSRALDDCVIS